MADSSCKVPCTCYKDICMCNFLGSASSTTVNQPFNLEHGIIFSIPNIQQVCKSSDGLVIRSDVFSFANIRWCISFVAYGNKYNLCLENIDFIESIKLNTIISAGNNKLLKGLIYKDIEQHSLYNHMITTRHDIGPSNMHPRLYNFLSYINSNRDLNIKLNIVMVNDQPYNMDRSIILKYNPATLSNNKALRERLVHWRISGFTIEQIVDRFLESQASLTDLVYIMNSYTYNTYSKLVADFIEFDQLFLPFRKFCQTLVKISDNLPHDTPSDTPSDTPYDKMSLLPSLRTNLNVYNQINSLSNCPIVDITKHLVYTRKALYDTVCTLTMLENFQTGLTDYIKTAKSEDKIYNSYIDKYLQTIESDRFSLLVDIRQYKIQRANYANCITVVEEIYNRLLNQYKQYNSVNIKNNSYNNIISILNKLIEHYEAIGIDNVELKGSYINKLICAMEISDDNSSNIRKRIELLNKIRICMIDNIVNIEDYNALFDMDNIIVCNIKSDELLMLISNEKLDNPVIAEDGHTYDRTDIENWFKTKNISPITGQVIGKTFISNVIVKNIIDNNDLTNIMNLDINVDYMLCPISRDTFEDPVVAEDGHTYNRKDIKEWFKIQQVSPMTRQPINTILRPNLLIKYIIEHNEKCKIA
jgi:hypothetical protein